MHTEITQFTRWLRCKKPHSSTHIHYASDLRLFFAWVDKPPAEVTVSDVDAYIAYYQRLGSRYRHHQSAVGGFTGFRLFKNYRQLSNFKGYLNPWMRW